MTQSTPATATSAPGINRPPFPVRLYFAFFNIAVIGVISGFFAKYWWVFDVLSSFRIQYGLLLGIGVLLAWWHKRRVLAVISLILFLANGVWLYPYLGIFPLTPAASGKTLTLTSINVHTANTRWDMVLDFVASRSPDIAFFTEVNQTWLDHLKPLEKTHPFFVSKPRSDNFGVALYSRIEPKNLEIINFLSEEIPSVLVKIPWGSETLTLVGTHPLPPRSFMYTTIRNFQMQTMGEFLAGIPGRKVLVGDLNTPPWSPVFANLLQTGGLTDSGRGRGLGVTWPRQAWWLFGIPIDHCLVSPDIQVVARTVGPSVHSDHYPLYLTLTIP